MRRLLTAAVAVPLALAAVFLLPSWGFFFFLLLIIELQVFEFVRLTRAWAPHAPLEVLLLVVPIAAMMLSPDLWREAEAGLPWEYLLLLALLLSVGLGTLALLARTPVEESMVTLGVFGYGAAYFALPVASLHYLQRLDPWVLLLLLAIVWLGDSAAYVCGTRWGRHRLARVVSPKKTWEGAIGGFLAALAVAAAWGAWRIGGPPSGRLLALAAVTAVGAQLGDLVESMIKRGAGIKDSGRLLPGHGGMLDRMDALMFAAPVLVVTLWLLGYDTVMP